MNGDINFFWGFISRDFAFFASVIKCIVYFPTTKICKMRQGEGGAQLLIPFQVPLSTQECNVNFQRSLSKESKEVTCDGLVSYPGGLVAPLGRGLRVRHDA